MTKKKTEKGALVFQLWDLADAAWPGWLDVHSYALHGWSLGGLAFIFILISFRTSIGPWYICVFSFVSHSLCSTCLIFEFACLYFFFFSVLGGWFSFIERSVMFHVMSMDSEGVDVLDWSGKKHFRVFSNFLVYLVQWKNKKNPQKKKISEIIVKDCSAIQCFHKTRIRLHN